MVKNYLGTLSVDLGNTNTVIAFQGEGNQNPFLIEIPLITSSPGVIPTTIWFEEESSKTTIGLSALKMRDHVDANKFLHSNFKRLIGNPFEKPNSNIINKNIYPADKENLQVEEDKGSAMGALGLKPKIVH